VVQKLGIGVSADTIIVNVQGDEPEIEPRVIDELVAGLRAKPEADMATLAAEFTADEDPADPNIVKVVVDLRGFAIYFSRSLIPFDRDKQGVCPLKHPGLYAYRRAFLLHYVTLPATPLEEAEKLEQLRALEHGHRIAVVKTTVRHHGIDTPSQYEAFVQRVRAAAD
jgi:3-deoxy-manno-octulosonate cytidylyltransferase (CMP-KDO synthetase)